MTAPAILVTGASGFVGRHAVDMLRTRGCSVTATGTGPRPDWLDSAIAWQTVDLFDPDQVARLPRAFAGVLHLAGDTVPSQMHTMAVCVRNADMVARLLDHLAPTRFMLVSSCHVYAPGAAPKTEASAVAPAGLYGLSKHLAEQLTLLNPRGHQPVVMRPFNHIGAGMRPELMIPQLLARIRAGRDSAQPLTMHGQDSVRDFLDVRDIVAAYVAVLLADRIDHAVYNVCSGAPVRISQLVGLAQSLVGSARPVVFGQAQSGDDTDVLVGDPARLKATGWQPRHGLRDSLAVCLAAA